ncbi:methylmalonyl-CoA epimerase [Fervidibacillus albus]|uniref:Methylmalonyl-CoA epimerase n=1 Tax=Fervidibacillus albus TaxID=2980026 RepID=A0A9E8LX98_9BACI|nr:methylmalonyl-CoA epimerase [Fervidibacillus albus]WAA10479.1 methylmalonyl-CoA epimerase [Fervidibacillus albus]
MKGIDHIGIAVYSIERTLPFYTDVLHFTHLKTEIVESEGVKVAFLDTGNGKIELLEPIQVDSPVHTFLEKRGEGIHHIALQTDDIGTDLKNLEENDIRLINRTPKKGAGGAFVSFLHPKSTFGVLYEICQKGEEKE